MRTLIILSFVTSLLGCDVMKKWIYERNHSEMSAEEVLESYLTIAFNMESVSEKEKLMGLTGGKLKAALAGATAETMQKAYIDPRYELKSFSIVDRTDRTPRVTEITFLLSYLDLPEGETDFKKAPSVETENTVMLEKEKGVWLMTDVLGQKSLIDFPVTSENEIRASANTETSETTE